MHTNQFYRQNITLYVPIANGGFAPDPHRGWPLDPSGGLSPPNSHATPLHPYTTFWTKACI